MAVLTLIIIIDILLVIAVMYWGSKESLDAGHGSAEESKAVAALRAKIPPATQPESEQSTEAK